MTAAEIKDYVDNIGKGDVYLFGYSSCSLSESTALSFAWDNKDSGHSKVLLHFDWKTPFSNYFLNAGAYDHEEEVLIFDGAYVKVIAVSEIKNEKGEVLYTRISLERR